jgi:RNA polymerase sigma factor (sigma-70 family)
VTADSRDVRAAVRADDTSAALEHVVERFAGFIHQTAGRHGLSPDEQDAAIQEVRIRLWKALETSENIRSAPASYVYRTTVSAVVDFIRRRRARREEALEAPHAVEPLARRSDEADAKARAGDVESAVERALGTLPAARQAVVRLHLAGYDRFEIADLMGWTEAKTRNHLYRSLELMRIHLKREGLDPGNGD